MREDDKRNGWLLARFRGADESSVVRMWKEGTNEDGKPLTRDQWAALTERWLYGTPSAGLFLCGAGRVSIRCKVLRYPAEALNIEAHAEHGPEVISGTAGVGDATLQLCPHFTAPHSYLQCLACSQRMKPGHEAHGHRRIAFLNLPDHAVHL